MLEFLNWFFSFFGDFVSMLVNEFEVAAGVSIGKLLIGCLLLAYVIRFLIGGWINGTFSTKEGGDE